MRRIHITHKRDNRRYLPSHFERDCSAQDPHDPRELRWRRESDHRQVMEIDGEAVAEITPFGPPRYNAIGEWCEPFTARIILTDEKRDFLTRDAARIFLEAHFALVA